MSKVFVFGGTGRVGTALVKDLIADGNTVTVGARHPEKVVKLDGVSAIKVDLHAKPKEITELLAGHDVVYFTAGSRGHDLIGTDAMGAIKTMIAAKRAGIKRYIMLSSMFSLSPDEWGQIDGLDDYLAAKFVADTYLRDSSDLDYTIIQPTGLQEKDGTGKIDLVAPIDGTIPIPDVARVLADSLKYSNTIGKVIPITGGHEDIDEVIKGL